MRAALPGRTPLLCLKRIRQSRTAMEPPRRGAAQPLVLETAAKPQREHRPRSEQNRTMRPKKVILLVDGNEQALSVRKFMLETRGYRVVDSASAQAALERFGEGGIDLIVSDLLLPGMDGNELVRRIKAEAPEMPALLLSSTVKDFARASAADAFLPKGAVTPTEMVERIRMLLVRKRGPKRASPAPAATEGYAGSLEAHA